MAKNDKILVQLRISAADHDALKRSAVAHDRSIPAEVIHRIGLAAGYEVDDALGDLAAIVAAKADGHFGSGGLNDLLEPMSDDHRARLLSVARDGFALVLNQLGAAPETITEGDLSVAQGVTFGLPGRIKAPPEKDDTPEGRRLAWIGEALGFVKARETKVSRKKGSAK